MLSCYIKYISYRVSYEQKMFESQWTGQSSNQQLIKENLLTKCLTCVRIAI